MNVSTKYMIRFYPYVSLRAISVWCQTSTWNPTCQGTQWRALESASLSPSTGWFLCNQQKKGGLLNCTRVWSPIPHKKSCFYQFPGVGCNYNILQLVLSSYSVVPVSSLDPFPKNCGVKITTTMPTIIWNQFPQFSGWNEFLPTGSRQLPTCNVCTSRRKVPAAPNKRLKMAGFSVDAESPQTNMASWKFWKYILSIVIYSSQAIY